MENRPIGIFDSGVGGLSILLAVQKLLPKENFIYLADQKNCPYGEKTKAEIRELSFKNTKFLLRKQCKIIVIACNTATAAAIDWLRKCFPKIPFIGVEPGVKPAGKLSKTGHIVILSTPMTQKSERLCSLIKKFSKGKKVYPAPQKAMTVNRWCGVYNSGCPGLADLIEEGEVKGERVSRLLKESLKSALKDSLVDVLVLGCTHYFFVKELILKLFPQKISLINPAEAVAKQVRRVLKEKNLLADFKKQKDQFLTSGEVTAFNQVASKLAGFKVESEAI